MSISSKMAKLMGWEESLPTKLYWVNKKGEVQFRIAGKSEGNTWIPESRIDQAMMVVEKLLKENLSLHLHLDITSKKTTAQFVDIGYAIVLDSKEEADTPQMAICFSAASIKKLEDKLNEQTSNSEKD